MNSYQLLNTIEKQIQANPQKAVQLLSNKSFLNSIFHHQIVELIAMTERVLHKSSQKGKPQNIQGSRADKQSTSIDSNVILCLYSIILMKASGKIFQTVEKKGSIFNSKLAIETLSNIYKHSTNTDVKKIVTSLLYKIPSFNNYKSYVKDIHPDFISTTTMRRVAPILKNTTPNLYQQQLSEHKHTKWGQFLTYVPFRLNKMSEIVLKLNSQVVSEKSSQRADQLIQIRDNLKSQYQYLLKKVHLIQNSQKFPIYEFCQEFETLYRLKINTTSTSKNSISSKNRNGANLLTGSFSIESLKVKIWMQAKNYLLQILMRLIAKLSTYWNRKLRWLYNFITGEIQMFGLDSSIKLSSSQQSNLGIQKLKQLKLLIKVLTSFYKQFGNGMFPQGKLKSILFSGEYSFYNLVEALLYNEYQFQRNDNSSRIVNYQKNKKSGQSANKKENLLEMIELNSKSLNIHPHYDLVLEKIVPSILNTEKDPSLVFSLLIQQVLRLFINYYQNSYDRFYGAKFIYLLENCKNKILLNRKLIAMKEKIKFILFAEKKIISSNLEFFCQDAFQNCYMMHKRALQESNHPDKINKNSDPINYQLSEQNDVGYFNSNKEHHINKTSVQISARIGQFKDQQPSRNVIRKTRSEDIILQGWSNKNQGEGKNQQPSLFQSKSAKAGNNESDVFYSIKECSVSDEYDRAQSKMNSSIDKSRFAQKSVNAQRQKEAAPQEKQDNQDGEQLILTPQF